MCLQKSYIGSLWFTTAQGEDMAAMAHARTLNLGVFDHERFHSSASTKRLELDDGATKKLAPRDVDVQNGTRHAWRNNSDKPATMLFVLVGARRS